MLGRPFAWLPAADAAPAAGRNARLQVGAGGQASGIAVPPRRQLGRSPRAVLGERAREQRAGAAGDRVEVEQGGRYRVQQPPVVSHDDGDAGVVEEQSGEAIERCVVEMVARLVEQQGPGRVGQRAAESEPVPLADRQLAQGPVEFEVGVERRQRAVEPALGAPGVHPFDACKRGGVAVVGSRGAGGQRRRCGLELGRRPARRGDRIGAEVGDGRPARGDELLLDKPAVGGVDDHSGVGLDGSGQQPQQCALPAAVLTDDGEALAGRNGKGNPVENGSVAEPFAEFARCEVNGGRLRDGMHETTS